MVEERKHDSLIKSNDFVLNIVLISDLDEKNVIKNPPTHRATGSLDELNIYKLNTPKKSDFRSYLMGIGNSVISKPID